MDLNGLITQLEQMPSRPVIGLALAGGSAYGIALWGAPVPGRNQHAN